MSQTEQIIHLPFPPYDAKAIDQYGIDLANRILEIEQTNFLSAVEVTGIFRQIWPDQTFTNILVLGCGYGYEFPALRRWLGQNASISGVDSNRAHWRKRETHINMSLGQAEFISGDMADMAGITEITGIPDFLWLRHPGKFRLSEGPEAFAGQLDYYFRALTPWVATVSTRKIPVAVTMYRHEWRECAAFRDRVLIPLFGNASVDLSSKEKEKATALMVPENTGLYYPDYWILTVNAPVSF